MRPLLWIAAAWAGMVADLPPSAARAGLLLCADGDCDTEATWLEQSAWRGLPVVRLDAMFDGDDRSQAGRDRLAERYGAALERALDHVRADRLQSASAALVEADHTLARWSGSPPNRLLFAHAWLRGTVAVRSGMAGTEHFQQATAVAWTQDVQPLTDGPELAVWHTALARAAEGPTGRLRIAPFPSPGGRYALNGVDLGTGDHVVTVLPGRHRVTCTEDGTGRTWRRELALRGGQELAVSCDLTPADDPAWLTAQLQTAAQTRQAPPVVAERLADWCRWHNVQRLSVIRVSDEGAGFEATEAVFDPHLRRFL